MTKKLNCFKVASNLGLWGFISQIQVFLLQTLYIQQKYFKQASMNSDLNAQLSFQHEQEDSYPLSYHNPLSQTFVNTKKESMDLTSYQLQITRVETQPEKSHSSELIQSFYLPPSTSHSHLSLNQLLSKIEQEGNFHFQGHIIMIYSPSTELFINFGLYPFTSNIKIDVEDYVQGEAPKPTIRIKVHKIQSSLIHFEMFKNTAQLLLDGPPKQLNTFQTLNSNGTKKVGIKNFQKIGYIVKAVMYLKSGKKPPLLRDLRFKLNRTFSKKSIQDYFNQIKLGHKYDYDFNQNSEQNMSHLRHYVKMKEQQKSKRHGLEENHLPSDLELISNLINHQR